MWGLEANGWDGNRRLDVFTDAPPRVALWYRVPLECENPGDSFLTTLLVCCIETAVKFDESRQQVVAVSDTKAKERLGTSRAFTGRLM
jgi:hypothetical protein